MYELKFEFWLLDYSVTKWVKEVLPNQVFSLGFDLFLYLLSLLFFLIDLFPEWVPSSKMTILHVYIDTYSLFQWGWEAGDCHRCSVPHLNKVSLIETAYLA
jgi:hypothetical protein